MAKIAIIGTGISGLSAAYLLHPHHDITVYEKQSRSGGHSRTVTVRHGDKDIPVDTGFIVYNERNYPNLTALFRHLGVAVKKSEMTFGLTVDGGKFEWGAKDLNAVFGQRRNLLRPAFYKLLRQVLRFNKSVLAEAERAPNLTLGELLARMGLGQAFQRSYILPMAGAIWSCPPQQMLAFPARSFIRFFENHGLLSMSGQPQWMTVSGGSEKYVDRLSAPFADRIRTGSGATRVTRGNGYVTVSDACSGEARYDEVVFACHADEALAILADPNEHERKALEAIRYQRNVAVLHKDSAFMPKSRRCWASWVYHADDSTLDEPAVSLTYWMNSLQGIEKKYPLFVTLNPSRTIAPEHVFDRHVFMHPVFDFGAFEAQAALRSMQGRRNTWFCGAHLGHGFHEDGLTSAIRVAESLGARPPWQSPSPVRAIGQTKGARSYGEDEVMPAEGVLQPSAG
jgi:predicted NAD/FAD-binding protein